MFAERLARFKRYFLIVALPVLLCLAVYSVVDDWYLIVRMDADSIISLSMILGALFLYGLLLFMISNRKNVKSDPDRSYNLIWLDRIIRVIMISGFIIVALCLVHLKAGNLLGLDLFSHLAKGNPSKGVCLSLFWGLGVGSAAALVRGLLLAYIEPIIKQIEEDADEAVK